MRFVLIACVLFVSIPAYAQYLTGADGCAQGKLKEHRQMAKATVASPEEEKYDVLHVHLDIAMDNQSVAVSGSAITTAKVLENNFALYVFELNRLLIVDSVFINGQKAKVERANDVANVFMPVVLQRGAVFIAKVYYHGLPETGTVFTFQSGMNNALTEDWNSRVTYSLSEPYYSKDWWPCKQSLKDKVDSAEIWITVPDSLKAGSNGLLQQVTPMPGNKSRYEWKTKYPMAYYLLSVAIGNYTDYSFTKLLPGGESVLVQNYVYSHPNLMDTYKGGIDSTGEMLYFFSELFGTYPFYEEKYGHCMAPVFGGMEHQTMTTLQHFRYPLVAHELAHQWFGNDVTCATWRDIWINEGFASYAEYLFTERYKGDQAAYNYMLRVHERIFSDTNTGGSIYLPESDTANPHRIFDSRLSYLKPSVVLHTLRFYINDDNLFFDVLRTFLERYAGGNAGTEDFKQVAEEISGMDLDKFFAQWIYGEGYPVYDIRWNHVDGKLLLAIQQQGTDPESVPYFDIPVEIKILSPAGDTIIRLGSGMTQSTFMQVARVVEDIVFDPHNTILDKAMVKRDYTLGISHPAEGLFVYPNPATSSWNILNTREGDELLLSDINGRIVWRKRMTDNLGTSIPAGGLAWGVYILHVTNGGNKLTSKKLVRL
ncbi:MAG TPA: M1 family aminopeptidase [Flavipsychrobacter sp.]